MKLSPTMKRMLANLNRNGSRMYGCTHPTLRALEERGAVTCGKIDGTGYATWSITDIGRAALS